MYTYESVLKLQTERAKSVWAQVADNLVAHSTDQARSSWLLQPFMPSQPSGESNATNSRQPPQQAIGQSLRCATAISTCAR